MEVRMVVAEEESGVARAVSAVCSPVGLVEWALWVVSAYGVMS